MASGPDEETGEIRPAPFELEPEPTPAPRGRKPAAWRASRWTGGAASVALFLLILGGLASSREGGAARGRGESWRGAAGRNGSRWVAVGRGGSRRNTWIARS